jgi:hypothetical protein
VAMVPMSGDDLRFAAEALRGVAYGARILLDNGALALGEEKPTSPGRNFLLARLATIQSDHDRAVRIAAAFEVAAQFETAPPVPDRHADRSPAQRGPPPGPVDTFPADHPSRSVKP